MQGYQESNIIQLKVKQYFQIIYPIVELRNHLELRNTVQTVQTVPSFHRCWPQDIVQHSTEFGIEIIKVLDILAYNETFVDSSSIMLAKGLKMNVRMQSVNTRQNINL